MTTNTDIMTTNGSTPAGRTGPPRSVPLVGDEPAMRAWAAELVERARRDGVELTGDGGLLTALVQQVLQTGLEVEMTDHLGYERHTPGYTKNPSVIVKSPAPSAGGLRSGSCTRR